MATATSVHTSISAAQTPSLKSCHHNGTIFQDESIVKFTIQDVCSEAYSAAESDIFLSGISGTVGFLF